jgi:hypothetical protein
MQVLDVIDGICFFELDLGAIEKLDVTPLGRSCSQGQFTVYAIYELTLYMSAEDTSTFPQMCHPSLFDLLCGNGFLFCPRFRGFTCLANIGMVCIVAIHLAICSILDFTWSGLRLHGRPGLHGSTLLQNNESMLLPK